LNLVGDKFEGYMERAVQEMDGKFTQVRADFVGVYARLGSVETGLAVLKTEMQSFVESKIRKSAFLWGLAGSVASGTAVALIVWLVKQMRG